MAISLKDKMEAYKKGTHDTTQRQIYTGPANPLGGYNLSKMYRTGQLKPNPYYITPDEWKRWPMVQGQTLTDEYQTAYSEAKSANEARYQEILAGYKTRYSSAMTGLQTSKADITSKLASNRAEVMSSLQGLGDEELAGIGRQYNKERSSVAQQLISSGMHSTTVAPAVQAGVTRREGYAMGEAQERIRREKLGYISQLGAQELEALKQLSDRDLLMQTGLTKEELDFQERREDEYPSESLYVQLMQGIGSS
jgi:hypothetical protein